MRITSLELRNFKGITADFELSPVTLVCGPNGSGKTAITDAIAIGTVGYHPRVGKTNLALFKFGSGPETEVTLRFDSGATNKVTLTQDPKGSIQCEKQIGVPVDPVLLDIREFLNMTGAERTKLVVSKARLNNWTPDALLGTVAALEANLPKHASVHVPKLVAEIQRSRVKVKSPTEWLDLCVANLKAEIKAANDTRKRLAAYLAATKVAAVPPDVAAAVAANDSEQDQLKKELAEFDSELASYKKQVKDRTEAQKSLGSLKEADSKRTATQRKLDSLKEPDLAVLANALRIATETVAIASRKRAEIVTALTQPQKERVRLQTQLAELSNHKSCPFCKQSAAGWQDGLTATVNARLAQLQSDEEKLGNERARLTNAEIAAKESLDVAEKALDDAKMLVTEMAILSSELTHLDELAANRAAFEAALNVEFQEPNPAYRDQLQKELSALSTVKESLSVQNTARQTYLSQVTAREKTDTELVGILGEIIAKEAALTLIESEQKRLCSEVFATLLATAAKFTDGILESNLEFTDAGLGRWTKQFIKDDENGVPIPCGGTWISHDVFSGREMLLAYAGLSVALAQEGQFRIVMLDECGRLDTTSAVAVQERLAHLITEGVIDQALMVDVDGDRYTHGMRYGTYDCSFIKL